MRNGEVKKPCNTKGAKRKADKNLGSVPTQPAANSSKAKPTIITKRRKGKEPLATDSVAKPKPRKKRRTADDGAHEADISADVTEEMEVEAERVGDISIDTAADSDTESSDDSSRTLASTPRKRKRSRPAVDPRCVVVVSWYALCVRIQHLPREGETRFGAPCEKKKRRKRKSSRSCLCFSSASKEHSRPSILLRQ
eukprot:TRINITY_DN10942_c0_g1_i1.p1 TRINITY_DN10942_c0_g1~~TRINITY_DN10942_c0_g1_i1.p1  ORF type:complete len:205 (-),score=35.65 TRINITY_DN10942_c0_g1_i1:539-1126(-)